MKTHIFLPAILFLSITGLAGCNQKDTGEDISIAVSNNSAEYKSAMAIVKGYQDSTGKKVKVTRLQGDYSTAILTGKAAHNLPDIVFTQDDTSAYFAQQGVFAPLDDYMKNLDTSVYYDSIMEIARPLSDNKTYFIPRDYDKVCVFYNKNIFTSAGFTADEMPKDNWTWSEFEATCAKLKTYFDTEKGGAGKGFFPAFMNLGWKAIYYPMMQSFGEDIFDDNHNFNLKSDSRTIALMKHLVEEKYTPAPNSSAENGLFASGNVAMVFTVRPNVTSFLNKANMDLDFVSYPTYDGTEHSYVGMGCSGYAINSDSKKKDAAWDFLNFLISVDGQKAFGASGNSIPMIKSLANDDCWKNIVVDGVDFSNKNNDAFVNYPERDKITNYMKDIPPIKHTLIYNEVDAFVKALFSSDYINDTQACINKYSGTLANIITK